MLSAHDSCVVGAGQSTSAHLCMTEHCPIEQICDAGLFVETVHPAFSTSDLDVKRRRHTTLKRLDFVRAYTEYYWSKANTIASMVCPCLPSLQAERLLFWPFSHLHYKIPLAGSVEDIFRARNVPASF